MIISQDAAVGIAEANVLRVGRRERGKRGQRDGDDSHSRPRPCLVSGKPDIEPTSPNDRV